MYTTDIFSFQFTLIHLILFKDCVVSHCVDETKFITPSLLSLICSSLNSSPWAEKVRQGRGWGLKITWVFSTWLLHFRLWPLPGNSTFGTNLNTHEARPVNSWKPWGEGYPSSFHQYVRLKLSSLKYSWPGKNKAMRILKHFWWAESYFQTFKSSPLQEKYFTSMLAFNKSCKTGVKQEHLHTDVKNLLFQECWAFNCAMNPSTLPL